MLKKALHISFEGYTAFFRNVGTITGTQICLPCPPYSTLLGLISNCAGKVISYKDTRIGFEYKCETTTDYDLERTDRLADEDGKLIPHRKGQGILKRYLHYMPQLDIYLTNTELADAFENPASAPKLGRSQDLAWITRVEEVDLTGVESGYVGPTLLNSSVLKHSVPASLILRCTEWFDNDTKGLVRRVGNIGFYQAIVPTTGKRIKITMDNNTLYHPSNFVNSEDVVYIHEWLNGN
jgi:CRISPR-associated protein Cas5t